MPVLVSLLGRGSGKLEKGACKPGDLKNLLTALVDGGRAALSVADPRFFRFGTVIVLISIVALHALFIPKAVCSLRIMKLPGLQ